MYKNQKTMPTTTQNPNDILIITNVGKLAYFFSLKHSFANEKKSYIINYTSSFYITNDFLLKFLPKGVYLTSMEMLDKFLKEEKMYCKCIDINDEHLLQIFTYFFNTIKN
jgi:hypothetical protein